MDTCGIPNKANYHVHVIIGRDVPGGTQTSDVDIYVCHEHMSALLKPYVTGDPFTAQDWPFNWDDMCKPVRSLFKFDDADSWDVLEFKASKLR